ncbi:hypothetical protein MKX03_023422 [Papaver bracteatum]|nr:hypothetical protein MKX03_023422 [Papaver bracteatum]
MATRANSFKEFAKLNRDSPKETFSTYGSHVSFMKRLKQLLDLHPILLFMKGNLEEPKCRLCQKLASVLKEEGVNFTIFDILTDNDVREGLKKLYNCPSFPQLFCKGNFLGGCDIDVSMHESGK